jgi:DNA mismatch repair ATPase MutS
MEVILGISILIITPFIACIYNKYNKIQLSKKLKLLFGTPPISEKSEEEINNIRYYYDSKVSDKVDVDDITWNDLDMSKVFHKMNSTQSNVGEEYLYSILRKLEYKEDELIQRNSIIQLMTENEDLRIKIQLELAKLQKVSTYSLYQTIENCSKIQKRSCIPHYLSGLSLIVSLLIIPFQHMLGGILLVLFMFASILGYYRTKRYIPDSFFWSLKLLAKMIKVSKNICRIDSSTLRPYQNELEKVNHIFKGIGKKSILLSTGVGFMADSIDLLLDYIRLCTHADIITLYGLVDVIKKNFDSIEKLYKILGMFDSMIAVASYRVQLPYYSLPELNNGKDISLQVSALYHPLINNPITNSIYESKSILITGSNASGKSTFIKAIAINAILSQTIYTSATTNYKANFFHIYTSMALQDNLLGNESYFIVEIKSIKRIMNYLNQKIPILCCIDEVLRGTNTVERIAASSEILYEISKANAICIAATHDIELAYILEDYFGNYHFREDIVDNKIVFNYKLLHGQSNTKNAIKLLEMLNYPSRVIKNSNEHSEEFMNTGRWNKIK